MFRPLTLCALIATPLISGVLISLVSPVSTSVEGAVGNAFQDNGELSGPSFRVMSWNIENFFDVYDDPYTRDQVTKPAYVSKSRQKQIAAVIKEIDADVIALQEVENRYLLQEFVDQYLDGMGYQVVLVEGNDTRGIDVGLLTRFAIQEVASYQHRRFDSSAGETMSFRRDLLRVRLAPPFDGDIYVVHLKSQHGDEVADVVREAEASEITKIMAEVGDGDKNYRAMVVGDFNEVPDMPTLDILRNSGLTDCMADSEKYSYNKEPYLSRIDYALLTPARQVGLISADILQKLGKHNLEACSDHYPLLMEWSTKN